MCTVYDVGRWINVNGIYTRSVIVITYDPFDHHNITILSYFIHLQHKFELFTPHTSLGKNKSTINQRSNKTKSRRPKTRRQDFIIGFNAYRGRRCRNRPQLSVIRRHCPQGWYYLWVKVFFSSSI